jgi:hypothetical protein
MPGMLLHVTHLCRRGVPLRACFTIGLLDCMMGRALVSCGMVMMGKSSITLCSALCALCWLTSATLCSSKVGGGASNWSIDRQGA